VECTQYCCTGQKLLTECVLYCTAHVAYLLILILTDQSLLGSLTGDIPLVSCAGDKNLIITADCDVMMSEVYGAAIVAELAYTE
jgi:hypothetical protein